MTTLTKDICLACKKTLTEHESNACWCNRCNGGYCAQCYDDVLFGGHGCKKDKVKEIDCESCAGGWISDEVNGIPGKPRKCMDCGGKGSYLRIVTEN